MKIRYLFVVLFLLMTVLPAAFSQEEAQPVQNAGFDWMVLLYVGIVSLLGIGLLIAGYFIWELITPYSVKIQLIEQKNMAVAIVVASFILGMAIIIAAALLVFK